MQSTFKSVKLWSVAMAAVVGAAGLLSVGLPVQPSLAADEVFSSVANKTGYVYEHIPITDLSIGGSGDETLDVNLYAPDGSFSFTSTTGVTFEGDNYGPQIQMSGSRSNLNAALATLRYYSTETGTVTIEARLGGEDGEVYNPDNGHVYQVVHTTEMGGINWEDAAAAARGMSYGGAEGYLATITSQEEHDFIASRLNQDGWIGANELEDQGLWKWVTGPEAGTAFWDEADGGHPVGEGTFVNWAQYEPTGVESMDCIQIWFSGPEPGKWDDISCGTTRFYYVVEYGDEDVDMPEVVATSFEITANALPEPEIVSLSPADNAVDVAVDSDLAITFNQNVTQSEGAITIYRAEDDSEYLTVENYDDANGVFEGYGSQTITIDPAINLEPATEYYILFDDVFYFSGEGMTDYAITSKTRWNFTTSDADGVTAAVENAAPNDGDANNDGVLDSAQPHVASFVNPVTDNYISVALSDTCSLTEVSSAAETDQAKTDGAYHYTAGLLNFAANCSGPSTTVELYYYDEDRTELVLRKYNPTSGTYATISEATIANQQIDGQTVIKASYTVADNGPLDLNSATGVIEDPVGLASLAATDPTETGTDASDNEEDSSSPLPSTGARLGSLAAVGLSLVVGGAGLTYINRRQKRRPANS